MSQVQQQYQQQEEQKQSMKGQEQLQKQNLSNETFRRVKFQNGNFQLVEDRLSNISDDECLIRVLYSSVNNYDKILMENKKCQDFCLGSEGVGIIERCGQNFDQSLLNKKVAFCGDAWADFAIKKKERILLLDDDTDLKGAIDAFVSPLTALCLRRIILQNQHRSIVLDGASCHLGRTLIQLCQESGIEVIAVVRTQDQIQEFRDQFNLKYVVSQDKSSIKDNLCSYIKEVEPLVYISCVGGDVTETIFNCMPDKSCLVVVGNLSNQDLQLPITRLFVEGKQIRGFFLERYLKEELSQATFNQFCDEIKQDFKQGGKKFSVEAQKEMDLKNWDKALDELQNLHGGKILLRIGNQ